MKIKKRLMLFFITAIILFSAFDCFAAEKVAKEPKVKAQGAILMDKKTGRVLWEKNSTQPLAMASTTKIMTAILALEKGNLKDMVKVSKKATTAPPVKMYLKKDEEISLENLLYALMLQSSNDAAVAIAEHIGGDVDSFCELMTKKAKELGCKDTIFRTPNGLDSLDHHSTAKDMAIIASYALNNSQFLKIINTKQISFKTNYKTYDIINKNRFLSEFQGAEGVKTGFTGKAGHCFVGAAKRGDLELISVVLASGWGSSGKNQKWIDTKAIMNYGFESFKYEVLLEKGTIIGFLEVLNSETKRIDICLEEGLTLPLTKEELSKAEVSFEVEKTMDAPVKKGEKVGKAIVKIGKEQYEINALAMEGAERITFKSSMIKILNCMLKMCLDN